jgi:outer membrane protein assembly factor BamB
LALGAVVATAVVCASSSAGASTSGDAEWLSYGGNATLSNSTATMIDPHGLRRRWERTVDGSVFASPVYFHDTVYVATEHGSVYALNGETGAVRWYRPLNAVQAIGGGCGTWGISSTPVIDPTLNALFVIGGDGALHALSLTTGADLASYPLQLVTRPAVEYVWGGLRIVNGYLYIPVASYCDEHGAPGAEADGRLIALDLGTRHTEALDTVAGPDNLGGVWGYGGVSTDGRLIYTAVGNADSPAGEGAGLGDHIVALTPAPQLQVVASNRPALVPPNGDEDFGATPLLFQPDRCPPLAAANDKVGYAFVWLREHIDRGPLTAFGLADAVAPFLGAPAWSDSRQLLVFSGTKLSRSPSSAAEGVTALRVIGKCRFVEAWRTATGTGVQPPPIVVGSTVFTDAGTGGFVALDTTTGEVVWRQRTTQPASAPPIEAGGRIFAAAGDTVEAIGDR